MLECGHAVVLSYSALLSDAAPHVRQKLFIIKLSGEEAIQFSSTEWSEIYCVYVSVNVLVCWQMRKGCKLYAVHVCMCLFSACVAVFMPELAV